ncbi:MAG: hypothetical protein BMS9Abin09_0185 [Gammaproteobacteria bacterium]|nr:MAG: hypothetical protein BMS9Abin09_0185 [Gammaproteobacteria bacterium]
MTQLGRAYDFKVGKRFFVMTRARENRLFIAQSYDRQFGEKYGGNFARYSNRLKLAALPLGGAALAAIDKNKSAHLFFIWNG